MSSFLIDTETGEILGFPGKEYVKSKYLKYEITKNSKKQY